MKVVTFNNSFGTMPLETKVKSIFDQNIAGNFADDGIYYCIHRNHTNGKYYALTKESEKQADTLGHTLADGQEAIFDNEKVRGMSHYEEERYNMDMFDGLVDLWGNVAILNTWKVWGNDLPMLEIKASCFDHAIFQARQIDENYCIGQIKE